MSGFTADLAELQATVDRLTAFGTTLEQRVEDLDVAVGRLAADWVGAAADEHAEAHARWSRGTRELRAGLDGMRRYAAIAEANYRAAIAANLGMWP